MEDLRAERSRGRAWVAAAAVLAAFAIGLFSGRRIETLLARRPFDALRANETLAGPQRDDASRRRLARAFSDPAAAAREMDRYTWVPPLDPAPFVGALPSPGTHANATIDSRGFRVDHEVGTPRPPGVVRVFLTGGSNAFGAGAPSLARTVSGYLGAALGRDVETITAANAAWTSTHERILIENRLSELAPSVVIALTGTNDVYWGHRGEDVLWMETNAELAFREAIERARGGPAPVRAERPPIATDVVALRLAKNARLAARALAPSAVYVLALQPTLATTKKRLSATERDIAARIPPGERAYFERAYAELRVAVRRLEDEGVRFVDLSGVFDALDETTEIFFDPYHWADRGNELVAGELAKHVPLRAPPR